MSNDTVVSLAALAPVSAPLTELLRAGARRLIEAAVSAEFEEYLSSFGHEKLSDGRQQVVRNRHLPDRMDRQRGAAQHSQCPVGQRQHPLRVQVPVVQSGDEFIDLVPPQSAFQSHEIQSKTLH